MSSARTDSKARLGVFVVSGLVLAIAGILALGAARLFERTVLVHCYFKESVQGLDPGSPISYRGVQVGRVARVTMHRGAAGTGMSIGTGALIEAQCDFFPDQLIRSGAFGPSVDELTAGLAHEVAQGLRVRVAWKDITGQKFLDLDYLDPEEYPPPDLGFLPEQPYIPTATEKSLTDIQRDLAATIGGLAKIDYPAIAARLQTILEQVAQKVSDIRADELSASFRDAAKAMQETVGNADLRRGLARFDSVTIELEKLGKRANDVLARPELDQGVTDLAVAAKSLRETAEGLSKQMPETLTRIDTAVDDARKVIRESKLPETTAAVRDGVGDIGGAARSVTAARDDLGTALRELATAARSIARLADYLERNPDAVLSGRKAPALGGDR